MAVAETKPTPIPFVDLKAQYHSLEQEITEASAHVLQSCGYILGKEVGLFEQEFAEYCEVAHAIGVDSGTSALELAVRACGIGPGDEVITATNTFIATVLSISHSGATPVLVDHDPQTYNIDIGAIERAITPRTRAIIPVHLYGQPADMDPILELAQKHNLIVLEDAAQAHGARYKGKRTGTFGHAAAFSFYPAKNLGACGDGGMVVTNDPQIADSVQMLRNYGQRKKYYHELQGFNRRLDTLQAAILSVKLRHLDDWNAARRRHATLYNTLLADVEPVVTPTVADYAEHVWHLYVVRVPDRTSFMQYLGEHQIATGIHYPVPVHRQQAYENLGYAPGSLPISEEYADHIVSLPMFPELTSESVHYVVDTIKAFFQA
ncbi:MAG: DegT/DnrJ/EryC1/StrS family aminotransferase [Chloroflexaceae bacterium]|nr:DegT/DnrJ/EryC1/StrS family aminotransferase [Chloroflexaceae bacterium]